MKHRFYCASSTTVARFVEGTSAQHPDLLPRNHLKRFINEQIPNFLCSVGEVMSGSKPNHLGARIFGEYFLKQRQRSLLNECNWAVDNGGFQISKGLIDKRYLDDFREDFHQFVSEYHNAFHFTFTLDMVPMVPKQNEEVPCVFSTATEMLEYNERSYAEAAALPETIREKVRCVFHFRGPRVFRVWRRLLIDNNLAASFNHFSTGGLAQCSCITNLPVEPFTLALVPLLAYNKSRGHLDFDFHVLGQASLMTIIAMRLLEEHIRVTHRMRVHFSHDAITPIEEASYRSMALMDSSALTMRMINLKSANSLCYFEDGRSTVDALYEVVNRDLAPYDLGPFNPKQHPYQNATGNLTHMGYTIGIINSLHNRTKMWQWAGGIVRNAYPIYEAGEKERFVKRLAEVIGDVMRSQSIKSQVLADVKKLAATLDFVTKLDPDYAEMLVCSRLVNEEHPELAGSI